MCTVTVAAAGANAAPSRDAGPVGVVDNKLRTDVIGYRARIEGKSVALTTDSGSLSVVDDTLRVTTSDGRLVATFPMSYQRDGLKYPIAAEINGGTALLTPSTDRAGATPGEHRPVALRDIAIDPQSDKFNDAVSNFSTQSGLGVSIGALLGTVVGATVGCLGGGLFGGAALAGLTIGTLAVPGFLGGCLVTAAALGAIGAVVGTVVVGGPVAVASALLFADALGKQAG
ncbi:hypothetical protein [Nocardia arthritidis]|uniref:hypothetical protein n=1 Tax=Nocardia arthritidis TaxID=228602 RepID=UPI003D161AE4